MSAPYVLKHIIDIAQDIIVPIAQDAIAAQFKNSCSLGIMRCIFRMLTAIDFNDEFRAMAYKICNISSDAHLPAEVRSRSLEAMAQMPPKFLFRIGRRRVSIAQRRIAEAVRPIGHVWPKCETRHALSSPHS